MGCYFECDAWATSCLHIVFKRNDCSRPVVSVLGVCVWLFFSHGRMILTLCSCHNFWAIKCHVNSYLVFQLLSCIPGHIEIKEVFDLLLGGCEGETGEGRYSEGGRRVRASLLHLAVHHKAPQCTKLLLHLGAPTEGMCTSISHEFKTYCCSSGCLIQQPRVPVRKVIVAGRTFPQNPDRV